MHKTTYLKLSIFKSALKTFNNQTSKLNILKATSKHKRSSKYDRPREMNEMITQMTQQSMLALTTVNVQFVLLLF